MMGDNQLQESYSWLLRTIHFLCHILPLTKYSSVLYQQVENTLYVSKLMLGVEMESNGSL